MRIETAIAYGFMTIVKVIYDTVIHSHHLGPVANGVGKCRRKTCVYAHAASTSVRPGTKTQAVRRSLKANKVRHEVVQASEAFPDKVNSIHAACQQMSPSEFIINSLVPKTWENGVRFRHRLGHAGVYLSPRRITEIVAVVKTHGISSFFSLLFIRRGSYIIIFYKKTLFSSFKEIIFAHCFFVCEKKIIFFEFHGKTKSK